MAALRRLAAGGLTTLLALALTSLPAYATTKRPVRGEYAAGRA